MINSRSKGTKKSSSYTDLNMSSRSVAAGGVVTNRKVKLAGVAEQNQHQHHIDINLSMSEPYSTPIHSQLRATPKFDGNTGGRIKLMDVPTQSSVNDLSYTNPLHQVSTIDDGNNKV